MHATWPYACIGYHMRGELNKMSYLSGLCMGYHMILILSLERRDDMRKKFDMVTKAIKLILYRVSIVITILSHFCVFIRIWMEQKSLKALIFITSKSFSVSCVSHRSFWSQVVHHLKFSFHSVIALGPLVQKCS